MICWPIAWPIAKLLDCVLGHDEGAAGLNPKPYLEGQGDLVSRFITTALYKDRVL